ncbi:aspartyl protease [Helicosporidium sp. ATCC 50920]|nr:aspartyl protease [Helicosporidium sp. ATCC 50920]|eukprot:KDD76498.1 aspartyl protease [Helicosporidium sp. ATCC 50920]
MLPRQLADAIRQRDVGTFQDMLRSMAKERKTAAAEEARFRALAELDPFNPEVQRRLEEAIQEHNVIENYEQALEHNPEAFGEISMIYVAMEVNGVAVQAFVDSGAQMTIMSRACAERCGVLRLMDRRFQGVAVGVGSAAVLGRVHMAPAAAGGEHFPISITVLDNDQVDFLFGLDNLRRHRCVLDVGAEKLIFKSTGAELPFLPDHLVTRKLVPYRLTGRARWRDWGI